jgi:hypothetical protein
MHETRSQMPLSRRSGVFAFAIMITIFYASAVRADAGRPGMPALVEEVLWWLPDDTEMIMVAQGPFNVADLDPRGAGMKDPKNTFRLFTTLGLGLPFLEPKLGDRAVALAVSGARRFRLGNATTGMIIPNDGAEIVLFRDDLGPLGDALLAPVRAPSQGRRSSSGTVFSSRRSSIRIRTSSSRSYTSWLDRGPRS